MTPKRFVLLLLCAALLAGTAACGLRLETVQPVPRETEVQPPDEETTEPQPKPEPLPEPTAEELLQARAEELLAQLTLEQLVGQVFFARSPGPAGDGIGLMERYQLGGYLLFKRDFQDAAGQWLTGQQLTAQLAAWREAAAIPPLFGVDEEGGTVTRASQNPNLFPDGRAPSPQTLYKSGGLAAIAEDAAYKSGILLQYGINANLAPVADVTTDSDAFMYDRAFGRDAAATAEYVQTVLSAMEQAGIGAVLKHFPGYGSNGDTHTAVVTDSRPLEQLVENDLLPFCVGGAYANAAVLVSHNIVTALDADLPASLSPAAYALLRQEAGFDGVAMTDDLSMDAVETYAADGRAAVLALQAGADMVITSNAEQDVTAVFLALEEGTLSRERLEEAALRVLKWKLTLGIVE